jgi:hypothetical protein
MNDNMGPVLLLGLGGLVLVLWLRSRNQQAVVTTGGGSPGIIGYGKAALGGAVSLAGSALAGIPPAVDLAGNAINSVSRAGAGVVNTGISSIVSVPKTLISETSGLVTSAGKAGASAGKSVVHALSLGSLF